MNDISAETPHIPEQYPKLDANQKQFLETWKTLLDTLRIFGLTYLV